MIVTAITYKKLVSTGNFEHHSLEVTVQLDTDAGDTPGAALNRAKAFVDAGLMAKKPTAGEWANARQILENPDAYTGHQVKAAQEVQRLCQQPDELPF